MTNQLEALIAEMKAAVQLIAGGYKSEWCSHHDIENNRTRLGCLDDDGQLSEFVEVSISDYSGNDRHDIELADFYVKANPANVLALIAALEHEMSMRKQNLSIKLHMSNRIAELETIRAAAEKLVRCKGRYHSEQNYRALAALFGVTVPDLPPAYSDDELAEIRAQGIDGFIAFLNQRAKEFPKSVVAESLDVIIVNAEQYAYSQQLRKEAGQ